MEPDPEIILWMKEETQFLETQNQPEQLIQLTQLIKPVVGNGLDLRVLSIGDELFDISQVFDIKYLELIYSKLTLDMDEHSFSCWEPLGHNYRENTITINAINRIDLTGDYQSASNLYHAIQDYLQGRFDLVSIVRNSSNPYKDAYIKDTGKVSEAKFKAWKALEIDIAFKANRLKFIQNPPLARELLETGRKKLISPHFPPWGYVKGLNGSNINGKMLMIIREDLRRRI